MLRLCSQINDVTGGVIQIHMGSKVYEDVPQLVISSD